MDAELANLWGPGTGALATLLVTDAFNGIKARLRRLLAGSDQDGDPVLPGELEEARDDVVSARARGDGPGADRAASDLEQALLALLRRVRDERPAVAAELQGLLAEAVGHSGRPAGAGERTAVAGPPIAPSHHRVPAARQRAEPRITVRPVRSYQNNEALLQRMDAVVAERAARGDQACLYLMGIPGIGKDALACRWLRLHDRDLTGPQLEASLGRDAWGNPPSPSAILERWLRRLGVPAQDLPAEPESRLALLAEVVDGRRAVFLLTDIVNPGQVRQLVPDSLPDSVVLLTSASLLPGLVAQYDAEPLTVAPLSKEHSRRLLVSVGRLSAETPGHAEAIGQITTTCDGLPLALVAVGAQLAVAPPGRVIELAEALSRPVTRMKALTVDDELSLPAALAPGYRDLDPGLAHVYRCLGLHPTGEFETDALRTMLPDLDLAARHEALRRLTDANLIEPVGGTGYRFRHALIHSHALECARADEPAAVRETVRDRITACYLEVLERAEAALSGRYRYDPAGVYPAYAPTGHVDEAAVMAGLERRHETLVQAVRLAHETGRHQRTWRMAQALHTYFLKSRQHTDWIRVHELACASAEESGDLLALARMRFETGFAHQDRCSTDLRDPEAARAHLTGALELVAAAGRQATEGERRTRSSVLEALGLLAVRTGEPREALEHLTAAQTALDGIEHPRGRALLALHRGTVHTRLGEHAAAEAELLAACGEFGRLAPPDRFNQAKALTRYAEDRRAAGLTPAALRAVEEAVTILDGTGPDYQTAEILLLRGALHRESGDHAPAVRDLTAARDLFARAGSPRTAEAERLLGRPDGEGSGGGDVE